MRKNRTTGKPVARFLFYKIESHVKLNNIQSILLTFDIHICYFLNIEKEVNP